MFKRLKLQPLKSKILRFLFRQYLFSPKFYKAQRQFKKPCQYCILNECHAIFMDIIWFSDPKLKKTLSVPIILTAPSQWVKKSGIKIGVDAKHELNIKTTKNPRNYVKF